MSNISSCSSPKPSYLSSPLDLSSDSTDSSVSKAVERPHEYLDTFIHTGKT